MKKMISVLLALVMILSLSTTVLAAENVEISVTDDRSYKVYQIFTGDLSESTLSNIEWGQNGTGAVATAVDKDTLDALTAVSGKPEADKLTEIKKYVNLESNPVGTVSKDASLSVTTGYYLLKDVSTVGQGQELSSFVVEIVGPTTIRPKVGEVTSEKKVKDTNDTAGATTDWQDSADYDIGDEVFFRLKGTVTDKYDHYDSYYYCFHDTLSAGLSFSVNSVKVYVDGVLLENPKEGNRFYEIVTSELDDNCTFEIEFTNLKTIETVKAGSIITVEYTATLNDNAVLGPAGNPNEMYLEYSNNPNGVERGTTPEDKVIVFTYKVVVNKIDGETREALKGAGFTLYKKDSVGKWNVIGEEIKGTDLTTFEWKGLDDGDYKLSETTTPAGYNTMADIEFTISATHDIESADPKLTALDGGGLATGEVEAGTISKDIENNKGTVLPETGAMGTMMFITFGSMLAMAAVTFMVTRKKMSIYKD